MGKVYRNLGILLTIVCVDNIFMILEQCCAQSGPFACEAGWHLSESSSEHGRRCYRFASTEEQTHSAASQACGSMGANLAVPSSQAEFDEFRDRTDIDDQQSGSFAWTFVWMGCGDEVDEGEYVCVDGSEISAQSDWWSFLQPDDFGSDEDCIVYFRDTRRLIDVNCDTFDAYALCEKAALRLMPVLKQTTLRRKYNVGSTYEDYCLINHVIYKTNARSVGRCAAACSARDDCLSFTYEGGMLCEMNDVTEEDVARSDFVQKSGCVYYEKM